MYWVFLAMSGLRPRRVFSNSSFLRVIMASTTGFSSSTSLAIKYSASPPPTSYASPARLTDTDWSAIDILESVLLRLPPETPLLETCCDFVSSTRPPAITMSARRPETDSMPPLS